MDKHDSIENLTADQLVELLLELELLKERAEAALLGKRKTQCATQRLDDAPVFARYASLGGRPPAPFPG